MWVKELHSVDDKRAYLTGESGGGHMAMFMAAKAWVGIPDLVAWHADGKHGKMMWSTLDGAPGDSAEVDAAYRDRSPVTPLAGGVKVSLDVGAPRRTQQGVRSDQALARRDQRHYPSSRG